MKDDKSKKDNESEEVSAEEVTETISEGNENVAELEQQLADAESKYKRALADYQNLQKRVTTERKEWIINANKELLLRILPVLDTLILANRHVQNDGLTVTIQQFLDVLKAEGVTKVETQGETFDPHTMECVSTTEGKENIVIDEARAGYRINEIVLRPAQVIVGKKE